MKDNWWESAPLAEETPSAPNVTPSTNWWEDAPLAEPTLGILDSASKTGYENNAKYNQALYERTGDPRFLAEAQKYTARGDAINGIPQQSSHGMQLGADLGANLESGAINVAKIPNQIASYLTDPNVKDDEDSIWRNGGSNNIAEDAINSGSTRAMKQMTALQDQIAAQKSDFSRSPQQNVPFITKSANPNDILPWNVTVPSISQASSMAGNVIPSIGLFEAGGEAAPFVESLGANTAEQTAARSAGYGVGNAVISAPQAYEDTYNQAYADNIKNGMNQKEADSDARLKADKVMREVAPIATAVGAVGGKFAPEVTGNVVSRFIKGSAVGATPMGIQGGAQYIAQQNALNKPIDPYELANQIGTNAVMAAPMEGGVAVREGKRGSTSPKNITNEVQQEQTFNPATGRVEDVGGSPPAESPAGATPITPATEVPTPTLAETTALAMNNGGVTDYATIKSLKNNDQIRYNKDAQQWEAVPEKSQPVDSNNPQAVIDAINSNGNVAPGAVGALLQSGEIQFNNGKLELSNQLSPTTNIDTAAATLNAIKSGDLQNTGIHSATVRDFIRSGELTHGQNGQLELTDLGRKLHAELNNPTPETLQNVKSVPQKLSIPEVPNDQNRVGINPNEGASENKAAAPLLDNPYEPFFDKGTALPEAHTPEEFPKIGKSESEPITKAAESNLPSILDNEKALVSQHLNSKENIDNVILDARTRLNQLAEKRGTDVGASSGEILHDLRLVKMQDQFSNPEKGLPALSKYLAVAESYKTARPDVFEGKRYSITPSDKFIAQKDQLKTKVTDIIKKINPSVDVNLVDKMFGEGEALKASGAKDTNRQEVAGAYDKLNNVVHASLNTEKWNPEDTAYHEAYHSIRDMVTQADDAILKKAFKGTDRLSQTEHEAVEFARFMTNKNATGFTPAIRRIFSAIRQALMAIGRTLKLGKFNSVDDIFKHIESGDVYKDYQSALRNGDIESLANSNLTPQQQQEAIKEVSPALHDVVYSVTPKDDMEALRDINVQAHGTPEQKAQSIGNDVYGRIGDAVNKGLDTVESAKEKVLRQGLEIVKPIIGEDTFKQAQRRVEASIAKTKRNSGGLNIRQTTSDVAHIVVASNDGFGRAIAKRTGSKTVAYLMDILHPDPGRDKGLGRTYHEEIAHFVNKTLSHVARQLHDVYEQRDKDAVRDYMVHPERMTKEALKNDNNARIAIQLSRTVQDMTDHLKASGYEVPQTEGFYPRIYDNNSIVNNEVAFKADARKAYYDTYKEDFNTYKTDAEVGAALDGMVNRWYNNILLQDDGITNDPNGYFKNVSTIPDAPSSFRQRVLSKAADDILAKWMVKDPLSAMNKLTIQTGRKAAWEKFFGGDKLEKLHQGMINDGLTGNDISHVMNIVRSNTGQLGGDIHRSVKNAAALSRYWTAVRFLTKAPFKHLSISVNAGVHTGNPINAWRTLVDSTKALFNADSIQATKIFAELAGITGESAEHAMLLNQSGMMSDNEKINFMSNAYYDAVGMTKLVGSHKIGMQRSIQYMLSDLADDIISRKNGFKSAEFMVKNYGIPDNEVQNFAQWIKDSGSKNIDNSVKLGNSQYADMYRLASQRATDQIISNPTAATRQMYASHPLASLIYQLSAYHMTAMKNSLQRNARLFAEGTKLGKDYDMKDRLRFMAPMTMYIPAMTLFMYGYNKSKDAIWPPDRKDETNPIAKAFVGADLFAQFNGLAEDIIGSKYLQKKIGYHYHDWDERKSFGEKIYDKLGPDFSMFKDYAKMITHASDNLSDNNKKKDAQIKTEYNNIVAPIVTSVVATYVPFAIPTFAAIQAINHPSVRRFITGAKQP